MNQSHEPPSDHVKSASWAEELIELEARVPKDYCCRAPNALIAEEAALAAADAVLALLLAGRKIDHLHAYYRVAFRRKVVRLDTAGVRLGSVEEPDVEIGLAQHAMKQWRSESHEQGIGGGGRLRDQREFVLGHIDVLSDVEQSVLFEILSEPSFSAVARRLEMSREEVRRCFRAIVGKMRSCLHVQCAAHTSPGR